MTAKSTIGRHNDRNRNRISCSCRRGTRFVRWYAWLGHVDGIAHPLKSHSEKLFVRALVWTEVGRIALMERLIPQLQSAGDAIVRVTKTTICGTDLHILKGDVATVSPGRVLGHEGVGVVESVGAGVTAFKPGQHVLISCISACGVCENCRKGMFSHCATGGWILGNTIDGTQAEYVRIPHANTSLYLLPDGIEEDALVMLSDILPTGFECGVLNGKIKPGDTVAIVGAGPVGLATLLTAQFYAPSDIFMIDPDANRLEVARQFGATTLLNSTDGFVAERVLNATGGRGVDVAIEAVGKPETFTLCTQLVAAGGIIANIGVHGAAATLHLENLWDRNITITTRLVDTVSTPMLLKTLKSGRIDANKLVTHRFSFDKILEAYETFGHAAQTHALKVIIST
jgi:alcohol dehydrogenase